MLGQPKHAKNQTKSILQNLIDKKTNKVKEVVLSALKSHIPSKLVCQITKGAQIFG